MPQPVTDSLTASVTQALGVEGPFAEQAGYAFRPQQMAMASAISEAIAQQHVLVAEAGTGVGKTYAYLVPALLSGARTLISTATKTLQDQLFWRDLPRVRDTLGLAVTIALLKGRGSYLCIHRLAQARHSAQLPDRTAVRTLAKIEQWAQTTRSGDLSEMQGLDERSVVIPLITSTRDNCLGSECEHFKACHVVQARREAMAADVVVVNHHLFFADMSLRETGMAELLPSVDVLVFDEAHQLSEAGVQFLGEVLSTSQIIDLCRDVLAVGLQQARGMADWSALVGQLERGARDLRLQVGGGRGLKGNLKLDWPQRGAHQAEGAPVWPALPEIHESAVAMADALELVLESGPDFPKLLERVEALQERVALFGRDTRLGQVRWIDVNAQSVRLVESPLDISEVMPSWVAQGGKAWVFTSATLGADEPLTWFTAATGLTGLCHTLKVNSPFDFMNQARLHVPARFPKPNEPQHTQAVADWVASHVPILGGRTFVLTTTLRAMHHIAEHLQQVLGPLNIEVLVQGQAPKRQLLTRFEQSPRTVLVGSQSFWEGVDMAGEALQMVVIDKLPFPPPSDPLVRARTQRLEQEGRSPFNDYFVPEAAVSLKQGVGRLIRRETDQGLMVITDPRLTGMSYGRRLLQALPPMPLLNSDDEVRAYLSTLTITSTKANPWG